MRVRVRIEQKSACAGCHAKAICSSSDSKEKIVDVLDASGRVRSVGDRVMVVGTSSMSAFAVVVAFVVPLVLMVGVIVLAQKLLAMSEVAAAGCGLGVLVLYWLLLWTRRGMISRRLVFTIED